MRLLSTSLVVLFACAAARAASLSLNVDRVKIYVGESVTANVVLDGSSSGKDVPVFENPDNASIEFLGSQDSSNSFISFVNGKLEKRSEQKRVFTFRITPTAAGKCRTGAVKLGGSLSSPGETIYVTDIETRPDIFATIECAERAVMAEMKFSVNVAVFIRQLPDDASQYEPILPAQPLHIEADFLAPQEDVKGIEQPDMSDVLSKLLSKKHGTEPCFSINSYKRQSAFPSFFDPFENAQAEFRLPSELVSTNGATFWKYSVRLPYKALANGSYVFGPAKVKGRIVVGVNDDRTPAVDDVFIIAPALTVNVVPPPEKDRPASFCGAIGRSLKATALLDTAKCKVGDPLTLTVEITGDVGKDNIRPPLLSETKEVTDFFRVYDDNVETETMADGKRFKYRLRPLKPGTIELPSLDVAFYDVENLRYEVVRTDAMPLQVEATTQIVAVSNGDEGVQEEEDPSNVPDGIMASPADAAKPHFPKSLLARIATIPPALWLLVVLAKALARFAVRRRRASSSARRAAAELKALGASATAADALRHAKSFVHLAFGTESVAPTLSEISTAMAAAGSPASVVNDVTEAVSRLERLEYSSVADGDVGQAIGELHAALAKACDARRRRGAGAAVVALFAALLPLATIAEAPSGFEWERANEAMGTARTAADFLDAANLYRGMVADGKASGPLFYNYGTALLLAERPRAAVAAFAAAERRMGTFGDVENNFRMALAASSGNGAEQIPSSRYLLAPHFALPLATRIDVAAAAWLALWTLMIAAALLPKSAPRRFLLALACASAAVALFFAASSAASIAQESGARQLLSQPLEKPTANATEAAQ